MATGFNPLGSAAYSNAPRIAIVQPAKDWRYYEATIIKMEENTGRTLKEYKESGVWRDHYKSWAAACEPLQISRRRADELIKEEDESRRKSPVVADKQDKKELAALKKVEQAREEEPEKPHIRTADEIKAEQAKPEPRKAIENGKPKSQLAIWDKAESIGGAYQRAIDDINRLCPNKAFHDRIISTIQDAMSLTRQWNKAVK